MIRACLYTYYRVDPAQGKALRDAVEALFRTVAEKFGVRGRWMRRRDDPYTFMEIYTGGGDTDVDALARFIQEECDRSGFRRMLADSGVRHDELFVDAD